MGTGLKCPPQRAPSPAALWGGTSSSVTKFEPKPRLRVSGNIGWPGAVFLLDLNCSPPYTVSGCLISSTILLVFGEVSPAYEKLGCGHGVWAKLVCVLPIVDWLLPLAMRVACARCVTIFPA